MYFLATIDCIDIAGRSSAWVYNQNIVGENDDFHSLYLIISRKRWVIGPRLLLTISCKSQILSLL